MTAASESETVVDSAGLRHRIGDLKDKLPSMIYLGSLHVDVCKRIAAGKGLEGQQYQVYVNLLVKHSRPAKNITALIILSRRGDIEVSAIESKFVSESLLRDFINCENVRFSTTPLDQNGFLRNGALFKLLVKTIAHRCYRLFYRNKKSSGAVIRSWVEITETMYGEHYQSSQILIYPFYLNLSRQLRYIRHCFKNYEQVSICGLPYSLLSWIKMALFPKNFDHHYVRYEFDAFARHGTELLGRNHDRLYTSDEFEAGALVMVDQFRRGGGKVVNMAHGLSFGCPYVAYDEFTVYNLAQKNYYARHSPNTRFTVSPRINAGKADELQINHEGPWLVVYVEANYRKFGMNYEADLEDQAIDAIAKFARGRGISAVIKAHPNRSVVEYDAYAEKVGLNVVRYLSELGKVNPVFVTIASAAYYDFRRFGPFIFIDDGYSDLKDFYGEDLEATPISGLPRAIDTCLDSLQSL